MLSYSRRALIGAVVLYCTSLLAGQPTPIPQPRPNPNPNPNAGDGRAARGAPVFNNANPNVGGESMIEELIRQMQVTSPKTDPDGNVALVARAKAALCPICNQPLHKHADPSWEGCVPMDDDGNVRRMQRILSVQAIDPVSNTQFTAALPGNLNDRGGRDRDNCIHSIGKTVVHSTIWISPETGYAAVIPSDKRGESFQMGLDGKPLSPEIKSYVREKLTPVMEERMKRILGLREENPIPQNLRPLSNFVLQPQIPDWMKYDHALQIYEQQKPPHAFLARLYYEAAHACRREVNSEVAAPALDPALQESLSKGIQRVNFYMMSETNNIRRERGSPIIDPRKAETDPQIITLAAERILTAGKRLGVRPPADRPNANGQIDVPAPRQSYFTTADMFLAHIVFAGAQNRLGNSQAAQKSLEDALIYVPEQLAVQVDNPDVERRIRQQLKMLRSIVFDRLNCLKKEQEWLFKSAKHNMAAVKFNEFKFRNYQDGFKPGEPNRAWDPAQFAYLTGELMRRAGEHAGARAWFDAAERLVDKSLDIVDAAEKANPIAVPVALPNVMAPENPYERERALMVTLKMWSREQRKLLKKTEPAIPEISAIVLQVMQAAGLNDKAINAKIPDAPDNPDPVAQPNSANGGGEAGKAAPANAANNGERPKTRDEMFKMYFTAIEAYRKDKKEKPQRLIDVVQAGYISQAQSCLDEKNVLFCPQTGERLLYMKTWTPGSATDPVILKVGAKSLFADGSIREHK